MKVILDIPDKNTKEVQEAVENIKTDNEVQKLNAVCFWLIKMCNDTNAKTAKIQQNNVFSKIEGEVHVKSMGSWQITVKKYSK